MKNIIIEMLFPEVANLYGDLFNAKYLQKCLEASGCEVTLIEDELSKEPAFVKEKPDFIYMGPMTEHAEEIVIQKLQPYTERLKSLIKENVCFLMTGNAIEIFEERIDCEDGESIRGLNLYPLHAARKMFDRYNSLFLGTMDHMKIVGFKSQFSQSYGENEGVELFQAERGDGIHPGSILEGIHDHNFMATYLLGPILVLNPDFTLYLMRLLGVEEAKLCFEKEARNAYELRLAEFENDKIQLN